MIHGIIPSVAETGKIKLGGLGQERRSQSGTVYRQPVKYDDFAITKTYRDAAGDLVRDEELMRSLPHDPDRKLRSIPIVLHSDEIDEVFPTQYARYAGKKLHCSGDGQTAERWELVKGDNGIMTRTGESKQMTCPCPFLSDGDDKRGASCKPHATLYCSIAVPGLAVAGAIYTFRTTSIITIRRIIGSLLQIKKMTGMLQGLPLCLVVQPVKTEKSTVYCAHIELRAKDVLDAQRTALESAKMRGTLVGEVAELNRSYRAMLTAPADETDEEQEAIADEFHPIEDGTHAPEEAPQPATATIKERLMSKRKAKQAPTPVEEPPHDPDTGEVETPLTKVLAAIANAKTVNERMGLQTLMRMLKNGDHEIAKEAYEKKQREQDASITGEPAREPGED